MTTSTDPLSPSALNTGRELRAEAALLVEPLAALADVWPDLIGIHHVTLVMLTVAPATAAQSRARFPPQFGPKIYRTN